MKSPQVPVTREGYPFIFFFAFTTLIFALVGCSWVAYTGLAVTTFVLCFFRDPERFIPAKEHAVLAPADGKVIYVEKITDDEYLQQEVYKISIFMNVFNVHVNRLPLSGTVKKIIYKPGKFHSADSDKAVLYNENCTTILESETGKKIAFVQVAGLIARRIVNWLELEDKAVRGERFGLIRFGSRVDIYLPADTEIAIEKGQKVRGGETIIGYLNI
ncbi:phosphatidylserine decarboxylase family protein [Desulfopila inferna]|uniref:phosphatidylserine decarboxylase family protein n=1 Tax=Desulfopila inferna TaxID=468528 RepID=UPI0019626641|nr:phosphatidylserine decarboxylase family protein [Desulfopila inferna]MBM9604225.1 phosphatidylserine decarboxylase family protein [Desulfopila inferna]